MGVEVDESGGDDEPAGVDLGRRGPVRQPATHDLEPAVHDPDVPVDRGSAAPVDDPSAPDDDVQPAHSSASAPEVT